MRFQKTTEYAIRVMVFLANNQNEWLSVNHLHQVLNIPYKYLGRLMHTLTKAGLLEVNMGKHGGYKIHPDKQNIFLYQIIDVTEGLESYDRCILGFPECSDENPCPLHKYWISLQKSLKEMIYSVSLGDLKGLINVKY
ncbi:MAG: Rrf2 family transcriptional regulator [Calditrichaceae bacterium]|nr:Rrf2 family transcriptional regulator [Calditrichaceae bacterium]MBN2710217.1 Rrf2 family transcriptional regulator [Calditrichaceae bacterium]RQV92857.1 MAG: Rrf2 family transcriptional regulator [Calditrichota bacterium]